MMELCEWYEKYVKCPRILLSLPGNLWRGICVNRELETENNYKEGGNQSLQYEINIARGQFYRATNRHLSFQTKAIMMLGLSSKCMLGCAC